MMQRRDFLRLTALTTTAVPALSAAAPASPREPGEVIGPYLQHPTGDTMTVMFLTRGGGKVEVGVDGGAPRALEGVRIKGTPWTVWKRRLTALKPGARHRYRLRWTQDGRERFVSPEHGFRVPDPDDATSRFLVFNDLHDRLESFEALLEHVDDGDYDFTCLLGDIWNDPSPKDGAARVFRTLDALVRGLDAAAKPMLYLRGNHELRGGFKDRLAWLFDIDGLDPAAAFDDQNWWSSQRVGPMFLIGTDTGEDDGFRTPKDSYKRPEFWQSYRKRQVPWLERLAEQQAAGDAAWTLFLGHIPLYDPARWHSDPSREFWEPVLRNMRIDLMLAGHDHAWKFVPAGETFRLQEKDEAGAKVERSFTPPWPILIGGGPSLREATVMRVEADREALGVRLVHSSGKVLHRVRMRAAG